MAYNKIIYKGDTLIDLTADTVTPETLAEGVTAHARNGEIIVGTMTGGTGGILKKKFMSFIYEPDKEALVNQCNGLTMVNDLPAYDEEILPTKTHEGIKVSFSPTDSSAYFYFIEDENNLFLYGDPTGSGNNDWIPADIIYGGEALFKGVITLPFAVNEAGIYIFFYYSVSEDE